MTTPPRHPFRFAVQSAEATSAKEWLDCARRAEELGYSTLFTTDHYFGPGAISDATGHRPVDLAPISAVMAAAGATTSLRVGCRVFCVDFHQPAVLAKELATIDLLSEGRLEVGLGAGWITDEYEGLGVPMDRPGVRIERLGEVVELIKAHFSGDPIGYRGTYVRVHGFAGRPLPVQQPHPPIFIGGGAPKILALAGRLADIVSINFNNASGRLGSASVAGSTLEVTEEKIGWIRQGAGLRFDDLELEIAAYFVAVQDDPTDAVVTMASRFGVTPEQLEVHPHALLGSIGAICEKLEERRDRLGISYVTVAGRNMEEFAPVVARLAGT
jgi:probable F420-dependent oxidoreductase